ncbi:MAG: outer rane efflux protein [Chitinophagaceae bacterium]|nr:outer rane efflux protein [Chitinophagaceae bacterium]
MKNVFLCCLLLVSWSMPAQELLTPEQVVEIALKNNYDISISREQADIAKNNYTLGNAGFLPSVNLNASGNTSTNNFKQTLSTGVITERSGINSNSLSASAVMSWTVFDGFRMFATYDKLQALNEMGELALKVQIENTVSSVLLAYYDVVRQKQEKKANDNSMKLYNERVQIADQKFKLGLTAKVDYLQARVDLTALQSASITQQITIENSKANLNVLLGRKTDIAFDVIDTIIVDPAISLEELKSNAEKQNTLLKYNERNILASKKAIQEFNGSMYPRLSLNAGYNYSRTASEAGLVALNRSNGPTVGFTATWNLFNGRILNTQIRNARAQMDIAQVQLEQSKLDLESQVYQSWNNAKLAFEILKLEEDNILLARENVTIAMQRYNIGNGTSIELMIAQQSFDTAQVRLVTARYNAITAEINLKRLRGEYVK